MTEWIVPKTFAGGVGAPCGALLTKKEKSKKKKKKAKKKQKKKKKKKKKPKKNQKKKKKKQRLSLSLPPSLPTPARCGSRRSISAASRHPTPLPAAGQGNHRGAPQPPSQLLPFALKRAACPKVTISQKEKKKKKKHNMASFTYSLITRKEMSQMNARAKKARNPDRIRFRCSQWR